MFAGNFMFKKIVSINDFGVYKSFEWDKCLKVDNRFLTFKRLNIIYGRNYSGKTTLSRILRCLELKKLHEDYQEGKFKLIDCDDNEIDNLKVSEFTESVKVFNKDFVKDNLAILNNSEGGIETFAILGEGNKETEEKIRALQEEIGSIESEKGVSWKVELLNRDQKEKKATLKEKNNNLNDKLRAKAKLIKDDREIGITTYRIDGIKREITIVLDDKYVKLTGEEAEKLKVKIKETQMNDVNKVKIIDPPDLDSYFTKVKDAIASSITATIVIEDLVSSKELSQWVKNGIVHNKDRKKCAFCDNTLTEESWKRIKDHFNKESEELEMKLESLKVDLTKELTSLDEVKYDDAGKFYASFKDRLLEEENNLKEDKLAIKKEIEGYAEKIQSRLDDIFTALEFPEKREFSDVKLKEHLESYNVLVQDNNDYTQKLSSEISESRTKLRLNAVSLFIEDIKYNDEMVAISDAEKNHTQSLKKFNEENEKLEELRNKMLAHEAEMKDESKGADKVNEYLANYFGHDSLRLEHFEEGGKGSFKIFRGGEIASNLSEGECSLIAFCYFVAKLHELESNKEDSIIWIDDPISSLDSNHIFYVFSLIENEITRPEDTGNGNRYFYKQLFLSTHNLDFLKYLKRLSLPKTTDGTKQDDYAYFLIERKSDRSELLPLPEYLKDYVTEFNYLFKKVKNCSESVDDTNYDVYYNFGNNLRKFLESYLYYKYPSRDDFKKKATKFFGTNEIARVLIERITNEYSHASGVLERGGVPVDIPEARKVAAFVLNKIKEKDPDQYDALERSVT